MISSFTILFAGSYIVYAYYLARHSSWTYSIITSILWGGSMHALAEYYYPVALNLDQVTATGLAFNMFGWHSGGFLFAIYIWYAWGQNRARVWVWFLMLIPSFFMIIYIPITVGFHLIDFISHSAKGENTIRQKYTHYNRPKEEYVLD